MNARENESENHAPQCDAIESMSSSSSPRSKYKSNIYLNKDEKMILWCGVVFKLNKFFHAAIAVLWLFYCTNFHSIRLVSYKTNISYVNRTNINRARINSHSKSHEKCPKNANAACHINRFKYMFDNICFVVFNLRTEWRTAEAISWPIWVWIFVESSAEGL